MDTALRLASDLGSRIDPDSVGCSITVVDGDGYVTPAASSPQALGLDEVQYAHNQGPCVAAARTGLWHDIETTSSESRWPVFVATAIEHGVASSLSVPLAFPSRPAALNLYSAAEGAFTDQRRRAVAGFLARCLSAVLTTSADRTPPPLESTRLRESEAQGRLITRALRELGTRRGISETAAFRILAEESRLRSRPLIAIARDVIGRSPGSAP